MPRTTLPKESNPALRCLRCGKKLEQQYRSPDYNEAPPREPFDFGRDYSEADLDAHDRRQKSLFRKWLLANRKPTGTYGRYRDNAFCGLNCGYEFGLLAAHAGYRLKSREG